MSAMGSVVIKLLWLAAGSVLPTGLNHARNLAIERELPEAQAADAELAQKGAGAPAAPAAVPVAALQLGRLRLLGFFQSEVFGDFGGRSHVAPIAGTASPFAATTPGLQCPFWRWS